MLCRGHSLPWPLWEDAPVPTNFLFFSFSFSLLSGAPFPFPVALALQTVNRARLVLSQSCSFFFLPLSPSAFPSGLHLNVAGQIHPSLLPFPLFPLSAKVDVASQILPLRRRAKFAFLPPSRYNDLRGRKRAFHFLVPPPSPFAFTARVRVSSTFLSFGNELFPMPRTPPLSPFTLSVR